jgi:dihydrofolate reductase
MRVVVVNHVTLDGVMQSPGRPDEDTRGGFRHGGWAAPAADDPIIGATLVERMGRAFSWLFGRRSYDDMLSHWNGVGGPFAEGLNAATKYVASSDPAAELPWPRSELLTGDVPAAVAELRARPGGNLVVMGSGQLVQSLLPAGLVDELFLMIHPLVLGTGRRLFGATDAPQPLTLVDHATTAGGITLATYRPTAAQG